MDRNKDFQPQFLRPTAQVMAACPSKEASGATAKTGGSSKTLKGILAGKLPHAQLICLQYGLLT